MINEEKAIEWWMEVLAGELDAERKAILDQYLQDHPELREELLQSTLLWDELGSVETPTPSANMEARFRAMLEGYSTATQKRTSLWGTLSLWLQANWQTGLTSLCIGLILGFVLLPRSSGEVKELSAEISQMKKLLMLTMIEQPQAQERIKAVNMVEGLPANGDERVIGSLISTLNSDESVNVRLAALDALLPYGKKERVREALVRSIARQDSPLLQVALADAMLLLREKDAIEEFNNILAKDDMDESVRDKLKSTVTELSEI